ncbi:unnamed protein product [Caretta caretta]
MPSWWISPGKTWARLEFRITKPDGSTAKRNTILKSETDGWNQKGTRFLIWEELRRSNRIPSKKGQQGRCCTTVLTGAPLT